MKNLNNIQTEVDKTIHSLDNWEQKKMPPFFYTRLKAKMEAPKQVWWVSQLFDLPALKPILFGIIILINGVTIWSAVSIDNSQQTSYNNVITTISNEYALNQSTETFFELNGE